MKGRGDEGMAEYDARLGEGRRGDWGKSREDEAGTKEREKSFSNPDNLVKGRVDVK